VRHFFFSSRRLSILYIFRKHFNPNVFNYWDLGIHNAKDRKAAYQFFLYTSIGSVLMLLAIFFVYFEAGTADYQLLLNVNLSEKKHIAKLVQCIKVYKTKKVVLGSLILVTIKQVRSRSKSKKGELYKAIGIRLNSLISRKKDSYFTLLPT